MTSGTDPTWRATPVAGLRLGEKPDAPDRVEVGFDTRPDPVGSVAQLPVRGVAKGPITLYRAGDPSDDAPPRADDLCATIGLDPERSPLLVPRSRWDGAGCEGVLFLRADDHGRPGPLLLATGDDRARVAAALARALRETGTDELADAVVPRAAIAPAAWPTPGARAGGAAGTAADSLCFALASCQYTVGLIDGTPVGGDLVPGPADKSCARLADHLRHGVEPQPRYLLLCGDQVYVDATAGLFDPGSADDRYRVPYERLFQSRVVRELRRRLPWCLLLDDHEIDDNFACESTPGGKPDWRNARRLKHGLDAYWRHQRSVGPLPTRADAGSPAVVDCEVQLGGFDFFFADTRTERSARTAANLAASHLMSDRQRARLCRWLVAGKGSDRPRFVVTPSAFIPRRLASTECAAAALHSDAWDGFPASMAEVLGCIAAHEIRNLVFLSGDLHRCCVATATLGGSDPPLRVRSIHSSGLYAPYPFANAGAHDYAERDRLVLGTRCWQVDAEFMPAADGFCLVRVHRRADGRWRIDAEFDLLDEPRRVVALDLG
jgi:hypothetical protein